VSEAFWLSILVVVLGLATIGLLVFFGLKRKEPDFSSVIQRYVNFLLQMVMEPTWKSQPPQDPWPFASSVLPFLVAAHEEEVSRRNEFWSLLVQMGLSMGVIVVITILLLVKAIAPDAGLPILSGVGGFAIGKGVQASRAASPGRAPVEPRAQPRG
jgi:hypothetical protein